MLLFDSLMGTLLFGSALIGLAAGLLTLFTGRVMNGSGMIGSLLGGAEGLAAASIAFIGGLIVAPLLLTVLGLAQRLTLEAEMPFLVVGGLLVGFAARFGGASLAGSLTGMIRRSGQSATIFALIVAGALVALVLRRALGGGGMA